MIVSKMCILYCFVLLNSVVLFLVFLFVCFDLVLSATDPFVYRSRLEYQPIS